MTENFEGENPENSENFDEKAEIEKLQEKIKKMSEGSEETSEFITGNPELLNDDDDDELETQSPKSILAPFLGGANNEEKPKPKKYVVTANPNNALYFENLTVEERSELFNEILSEYIKNEDKIKGKKSLKKLFLHAVIALLTLIIALPALFFIVNKSIQLTVENYKHTQQNFEKLYESRGVRVDTHRRR